MPIIDRQRRLAEVGRIRMGEQKTTSKGKKYPSAIDTWRLTSRVKDRLEAAALIYGGQVKPWDDQYELYTETDTLNVMIAPGEAVTQWFELWSAGGCQRRCDGQREVLTDSVCICDPDNRECKATTRLNVILPDVPGLGVWRLESHGYYASVELAGTAEFVQSLGKNLILHLRLEPREAKVGGETKKFVVPVLDVALSVHELRGGEVPQSYTPLPAREKPTVREALEQANEPPPENASRRNAQAELGPAAPVPPPPTAPIPVEDDGVPSVPEAPSGSESSTGYQITDAMRKRLFAIGRERSVPEYELKRLLKEVTGQESTKSIGSRQEYEAVCTALEAWEPMFETLEGEIA